MSDIENDASEQTAPRFETQVPQSSPPASSHAASSENCFTPSRASCEPTHDHVSPTHSPLIVAEPMSTSTIRGALRDAGLCAFEKL